jgi:hypothetical protein
MRQPLISIGDFKPLHRATLRATSGDRFQARPLRLVPR